MIFIFIGPIGSEAKKWRKFAVLLLIFGNNKEFKLCSYVTGPAEARRSGDDLFCHLLFSFGE